jgi:ANTAR domain
VTSEHRGKTENPGAGPLDALAPGAGDGAGPYLAPGGDPVVRRTRDGWRVGDEEVPDLTCAMVLADLLAADLHANAPGADGPGTAGPRADGPRVDGPRAGRARADGPATDGQSGATPRAGRHLAGRSGDERQPSAAAASEAHRLRATVSQLQYALTARIRIEQAIGVLAERHRIHPLQAFEQLRAAARNRGRKVIDIATDVVASATNPLLQLPDELSRPRSAGRRAVRQPHGAH